VSEAELPKKKGNYYLIIGGGGIEVQFHQGTSGGYETPPHYGRIKPGKPCIYQVNRKHFQCPGFYLKLLFQSYNQDLLSFRPVESFGVITYSEIIENEIN
jgi:hypothetical protein